MGLIPCQCPEDSCLHPGSDICRHYKPAYQAGWAAGNRAEVAALKAEIERLRETAHSYWAERDRLAKALEKIADTPPSWEQEIASAALKQYEDAG